MQEIKRGAKSVFIGLVGGWHGSGKERQTFDRINHLTLPSPQGEGTKTVRL
jgi:hypothetical protein